MIAAPLSGILSQIGMVIIFAAPIAFGCQPPWLSGFLLAAILVLSGLFICARVVAGKRFWFGPQLPLVAGSCVVGWLLITVLFDLLLGPEHGRLPARSLRTVVYALAFLGAAILGGARSRTRMQFKLVLRCLGLLGMAMASFAVADWLGYHVKELALFDRGDPSRVSGLYTNPNRFAVLMSVCWTAGLAGFWEEIFGESSYRHKGVGLILRRVALLSSLLFMGLAIGLTLSRLTMLATALSLFLAAAACVAGYRRAVYNQTFRYRGENCSPVDRLKRYLLMTLPLLVLATWGAWTVSLGAAPFRQRLVTAIEMSDPSLEQRWKVLKATLQLIISAPVFGHGLGAFSSVFPRVQPLSTQGWWREAHSDWLELAAEAGLPALLLCAALFLICARVWWLRISHDARRGVENAVPFALAVCAILITVICSMADFPLREPATAMLVFFLAGALLSDWLGENGHTSSTHARESGLARSVSALGYRAFRSAGLAIGVALIVAAFIPARNALAYASSPWVLQITCPTPRSVPDATRWDRARQIDSGDPELQYRFALAIHATGDRTLYPQAQAALALAMSANLHSHRYAWLAVTLAEETGATEQADTLCQKALSLAPNDVPLRQGAAEMFLARIRGRPFAVADERDRNVARVVENFRVVITAAPSLEARAIELMLAAGCFHSEIAALWPGDDDVALIRRSQFFLEHNQLAEAERALLRVAPTKVRQVVLTQSFLGVIAIRRNLAGEAAAHLVNAFNNGDAVDLELERMLIAEIPAANVETSEAITAALLEKLIDHPLFAMALARNLMRDKSWLHGEHILSRIAPQNASATAMWAEMELQMGQYAAASERADRAFYLGYSGEWYDEFMVRLRNTQKAALKK